jgi:hypothetical protein
LSGTAEAPQMDAAPLYITIEEAAQLVSIDPKTLSRWSREVTDFPVWKARLDALAAQEQRNSQQAPRNAAVLN